ncbi:YgaP family membrane protein, partial [Loktanella sp. DJP18]|uniref:YgaP family membrane protein n=1 Tax=Loktanella sp. DJP18 TaxID=3409788 RepID=UPI003BB7D77C
KTDRALRLVLGVVLLALAWIAPIAVFHGTLVVTLATIVGLVMVGTALFRFCPLYGLLGLNTCPVK